MIKKILLLFIFLMSFTTPEKVLFVGDSLTCYPGGWQDMLTKKMGWKSDNISQIGKTTDWMNKKLIYQLKTNSYDKVFIYGGCNDAFGDVDLNKVVKNVQNMIDLCNKNNIEVYVICGYDVNKVMRSQKPQKRYGELMRKYLNELRDCHIICPCKTVEKGDSEDGVHINLNGQKKFYKWILSNL